MNGYHQVRLDNLYMSAKFDLGFFNHPKKVINKGGSRTSSRGVPTQILQQEVTTKESINAVNGTVKVCVLKGVPALSMCTLFACPIYDTNPVHFISMCSDNITWNKNTRQKWDKSTSFMMLGRFLGLSTNDSYNINMNNVNISDQLRGSSRPDRRMRKHKWW